MRSVMIGTSTLELVEGDITRQNTEAIEVQPGTLVAARVVEQVKPCCPPSRYS